MKIRQIVVATVILVLMVSCMKEPNTQPDKQSSSLEETNTAVATESNLPEPSKETKETTEDTDAPFPEILVFENKGLTNEDLVRIVEENPDAVGINLGSNQITDITPLGKLTKLNKLDLSG
ncbi:hypothetical protein AGMMS49975_06200 [Clostridia bacterium]|nr:hypothetical protein AGMMS49975_06200 [Clostridia bacterium]